MFKCSKYAITYHRKFPVPKISLNAIFFCMNFKKIIRNCLSYTFFCEKKILSNGTFKNEII